MFITKTIPGLQNRQLSGRLQLT